MLKGAFLTIIGFTETQSVAQQGAAPFAVIPGDLYSGTFDRIFPQPTVNQRPKGSILSFVMRFYPGLDPALGTESQIRVILTPGVAPVVEYYLAERRVSSVLGEVLASNPQPDVAAVAARMRVIRRQGNVTSSQVLKWQKKMLQAVSSSFNSLPAQTKRANDTGGAQLWLDASSYELWYSSGPEFRVFFDDPTSPFAKWADGFRSEIAAKVKPQGDAANGK